MKQTFNLHFETTESVDVQALANAIDKLGLPEGTTWELQFKSEEGELLITNDPCFAPKEVDYPEPTDEEFGQAVKYLNQPDAKSEYQFLSESGVVFNVQKAEQGDGETVYSFTIV